MGEEARWESDPLFPAAEVVQDSADRMESVFRTLLHEQSMSKGPNPDPKLLSLMRYHKRDLATAIETSKWQLEDFERAVNLVSSSSKSNLREHAISRHRHFIEAIREHIGQIRKSVKSSSFEISENAHAVNFSEQETDGLALFLSGCDSRKQTIFYDPGNKDAIKHLNSNDGSDEIVDLKVDRLDQFPINDLNCSEYNGSSSKDFTWKDRTSNLEASRSGANCYMKNNLLKSTIWRYLRKFWLPYSHQGYLTKKVKDGEVIDNFISGTDERMLPSTSDTPSLDQDNHARFHCIPHFITYRSYHHKAFQLDALYRLFRRYQYLVLHSQFGRWIFLVILMTLAFLGFLVFLGMLRGGGG